MARPHICERRAQPNILKRSYEKVTREYTELNLIQRKIGALPRHVKILPADTDVSTYSLFQSIDFGVTVRGTVGMELACFGVPCLTAGTGRYARLGFTVDSSSVAEYLGHLGSLHLRDPLPKEAIARAKWHAYAAFLLRPWMMKSFRTQFLYGGRGAKVLAQNLLVEADSCGSMQRNGDLEKFARWVDGVSSDFVDWSLLESGESAQGSVMDDSATSLGCAR